MKTCEVCGNSYGELHHIIFRSQNKHMINIEINFIYLCQEHHRGNNSPHRKRELDLKYKRELQIKLFELFEKEYLTVKDIKSYLNTTETNANKIVKTLKIEKEGYARSEVIKTLLGGRFYE